MRCPEPQVREGGAGGRVLGAELPMDHDAPVDARLAGFFGRDPS
jgi:hypothetical protein